MSALLHFRKVACLFTFACVKVEKIKWLDLQNSQQARAQANTTHIAHADIAGIAATTGNHSANRKPWTADIAGITMRHLDSTYYRKQPATRARSCWSAVHKPRLSNNITAARAASSLASCFVYFAFETAIVGPF